MNAFNKKHVLQLDKEEFLKNYSLWQYNSLFIISF